MGNDDGRVAPCSRDFIDKGRVNVRCSIWHEPPVEYYPERLAARERQHKSAQDNRPRWQREVAVARRSRGVADGNERASRWSTSAQMRVAPGISSKAGGPRGGEGAALRAYARTMRRASAGRHSILSSLLEFVSDQRFRGRRAGHPT